MPIRIDNIRAELIANEAARNVRDMDDNVANLSLKINGLEVAQDAILRELAEIKATLVQLAKSQTPIPEPQKSAKKQKR